MHDFISKNTIWLNAHHAEVAGEYSNMNMTGAVSATTLCLSVHYRVHLWAILFFIHVRNCGIYINEMNSWNLNWYTPGICKQTIYKGYKIIYSYTLWISFQILPIGLCGTRYFIRHGPIYQHTGRSSAPITTTLYLFKTKTSISRQPTIRLDSDIGIKIVSYLTADIDKWLFSLL